MAKTNKNEMMGQSTGALDTALCTDKSRDLKKADDEAKSKAGIMREAHMMTTTEPADLTAVEENEMKSKGRRGIFHEIEIGRVVGDSCKKSPGQDQ